MFHSRFCRTRAELISAWNPQSGRSVRMTEHAKQQCTP